MSEEGYSLERANAAPRWMPNSLIRTEVRANENGFSTFLREQQLTGGRQKNAGAPDLIDVGKLVNFGSMIDKSRPSAAPMNFPDRTQEFDSVDLGDPSK